MRNTLLLSLLMVGLLAVPSYALVTESVPITFLSGTSVNKIDVTATVYSQITSTDTDVVTASGTLGGNFNYAFNGGDLTHPTLKSLNINTGTFALTNIDLDLQAKINYSGLNVTADIDATTNNVGGIVRTLNPPATVTNGTNFAANKQKATMNTGTQRIKAKWSIFTVYDETTSFSTNPVWGISSGTGTVTTTCLSHVGYDYTYLVHMELPLSIVESDTISVEGNTVSYTLNATGTAIAEGTFMQTIIPGDANWDGFVDGSDATILANYWQYGTDMTVPNATWEMGDFNGDHVVDGSDATLLASYWQEGTPPEAAAVPEPGTIVLVLSALVGLALIRRRR